MPHIQDLTIKNYRVLRNVTIKGLQPFNVLLGPNGCGKSTVFDLLGFLGECLAVGVRKALEPRGRLQELRSRGSRGPIVVELKYRESDFGASRRDRTPLITYHLEIDEVDGGPAVRREFLRWTRGPGGRPFNFLDITNGKGYVISGEQPEDRDERRSVKLDDVTVPAIATLGQLAENPRVASLRRFIESWYLSYFLPDRARGVPEAGAHEHLSRTGENLANVVQYLHENHPEVLKQILSRMAERIPGLETVSAKRTIDGRLVLRFKDGPFKDPFLSRFVSDGTLKMFAYLVLLMDPEPPALLCIEEPENGLHPKLLHVLAEEFRAHAMGEFSSKRTQVLVSSHAPYFVDAVRPQELWIMERAKDGFARVQRADRIEGVPQFIQEGAVLGRLWMEGLLRGGNP
jgi:predicted ATPase